MKLDISQSSALITAVVALSEVVFVEGQPRLSTAFAGRRVTRCEHSNEALCGGIPIGAPGDGAVDHYSASLGFDESAVYVLSTVAGCSYTFTFCSNGGTSASRGGPTLDHHPYIAVSFDSDVK